MTLNSHLSGACVLASLLCLIAGVLPRLIASPTPLGPMARMFDSVPFWMLTLAAFFAGLVLVFGSRGTGIGLLLAAAVSAGALIADHRALSLPTVPSAPPDLRIVFHNVLHENTTPTDDYMAAIQALDPDVVILAEPDILLPQVSQDLPGFTQLTPCWFEPCNLLMATSLDVRRHWVMSLNPVFGDRYGVIELDTNSGKTVMISVAHLLKPWMSSVSDAEWERLSAQYDWLSGPAVSVGDFNTAPWSRPMRQLLNETGFRAMRAPPATWPTQAGRWGLPIDQVLVKGGARVVSATPFGATLGSNHRGLVIDIALQ